MGLFNFGGLNLPQLRSEFAVGRVEPYSQRLIEKGFKLGTPKSVKLAEELLVAEKELKHSGAEDYESYVEEANWYQKELSKELRKNGVRV